jgi:hypothetical protein
MALESRGTNFLSRSDLRFTDEELQIEYAGDLGGEYIYRMADLTLRWGSQRFQGSGIFQPAPPITPPPDIRRPNAD